MHSMQDGVRECKAASDEQAAGLPLPRRPRRTVGQAVNSRADW